MKHGKSTHCESSRKSSIDVFEGVQPDIPLPIGLADRLHDWSYVPLPDFS